jgi:signal transduction histidine kinase/CheY-like chemotaxis protein
MLSTFAMRGVTDLHPQVAEHPEFVLKAAALIRIVDVNDATLGLLEAGRDDLLGPLDRLLTEDAPMGIGHALHAIFRGDSHFECEGRVHTRRGKLLDAVIHYVIPAEDDRQHHMLVSVIDITERKRTEAERVKLEEQLRHSQRMESIGRLAGGMAHDFNNMLAPIIGYSDMLLGGLDPGNPSREGLREILGAANRARDLTRQLLAFSRRQILSLQPTDLCSVVTGFEKLARHTIREDIRIDVRLPPAAVVVRADVGQMEQVLMNLVVNAQDAMPSGGVLTLSLEQTSLAEDPGRSPPDARAGHYALLCVSDTGVGMEPSVLEHLFEPFFTTKGPGKGTGLGLSMVYGIVEQHGGSLDVASEPGKGSTFRIYLPRDEGEGARVAEVPAAPREALRGSETVLVVEDRDEVRRLTGKMLELQGYTVLSAGSADEAISVVAGDRRHIDLLLTDVIMPGANGRELFVHLSASRPGLKVLYMSGYAGDTIARHGVLEAGVSLLSKPFTLATLSRKVREVLDSGRVRPG